MKPEAYERYSKLLDIEMKNSLRELKKKLSENHDKEPSFMKESEKISHTIHVDDSSKTFFSYSLTRNFDSYSQELLSKTFAAEAGTIFLEEVINLAKYFNAIIIKKEDKK